MTITLPITKRDETTSTASLRANGQVPGVVYGPKQEPITIAVDAIRFDKVCGEAGESTIVNLDGLGEDLEVLIKDVEFNPVKQEVLHVDFYAIERGKEMTVTVPIDFVGEAPVVKSQVGTVTKALQEISVTCRPSKLPSEITVDISVLTDVDSQIHVSDLPVLEGVTYEAESNDVVAVVSASKEEEEVDDTETVDMEAIAVEQKGKGEETATETE